MHQSVNQRFSEVFIMTAKENTVGINDPRYLQTLYLTKNLSGVYLGTYNDPKSDEQYYLMQPNLATTKTAFKDSYGNKTPVAPILAVRVLDLGNLTQEDRNTYVRKYHIPMLQEYAKRNDRALGINLSAKEQRIIDTFKSTTAELNEEQKQFVITLGDMLVDKQSNNLRLRDSLEKLGEPEKLLESGALMYIENAHYGTKNTAYSKNGELNPLLSQKNHDTITIQPDPSKPAFNVPIIGLQTMSLGIKARNSEITNIPSITEYERDLSQQESIRYYQNNTAILHRSALKTSYNFAEARKDVLHNAYDQSESFFVLLNKSIDKTINQINTEFTGQLSKWKVSESNLTFRVHHMATPLGDINPRTKKHSKKFESFQGLNPVLRVKNITDVDNASGYANNARIKDLIDPIDKKLNSELVKIGVFKGLQEILDFKDEPTKLMLGDVQIESNGKLAYDYHLSKHAKLSMQYNEKATNVVEELATGVRLAATVAAEYNLTSRQTQTLLEKAVIGSKNGTELDNPIKIKASTEQTTTYRQIHEQLSTLAEKDDVTVADPLKHALFALHIAHARFVNDEKATNILNENGVLVKNSVYDTLQDTIHLANESLSQKQLPKLKNSSQFKLGFNSELSNNPFVERITLNLAENYKILDKHLLLDMTKTKEDIIAIEKEYAKNTMMRLRVVQDIYPTRTQDYNHDSKYIVQPLIDNSRVNQYQAENIGLSNFYTNLHAADRKLGLQELFPNPSYLHLIEKNNQIVPVRSNTIVHDSELSKTRLRMFGKSNALTYVFGEAMQYSPNGQDRRVYLSDKELLQQSDALHFTISTGFEQRHALPVVSNIQNRAFGLPEWKPTKDDLVLTGDKNIKTTAESTAQIIAQINSISVPAHKILQAANTENTIRERVKKEQNEPKRYASNIQGNNPLFNAINTHLNLFKPAAGNTDSIQNGFILDSGHIGVSASEHVTFKIQSMELSRNIKNDTITFDNQAKMWVSSIDNDPQTMIINSVQQGLRSNQITLDTTIKTLDESLRTSKNEQRSYNRMGTNIAEMHKAHQDNTEPNEQTFNPTLKTYKSAAPTFEATIISSQDIVKTSTDEKHTSPNSNSIKDVSSNNTANFDWASLKAETQHAQSLETDSPTKQMKSNDSSNTFAPV